MIRMSSKPLRETEVTRDHAASKRDKTGWDDLCTVLDAVQASTDPDFTEVVFRQILIEIYRHLSAVHVVYPVPRRIRLDQCMSLIDQFLAMESGGDRAQAVAAALFRVIGENFDLYSDVRRSHTNTADTFSGQVADLECVSDTGDIVLAVEVKDRALLIKDVQDKLPRIRERKVAEVFFIALGGISKTEAQGMAALIDREFVSGQNIYIFESLASLLRPILALVGEDGRREFLEAVGNELDAFQSDISHRHAWATLLAQV